MGTPKARPGPAGCSAHARTHRAKESAWHMSEMNEPVAPGVPLSLAAYNLVPPVELVALPHQGVNNQNAGIHSESGDFVVKTYTSYDDPASIHYEHHLLTWLAEEVLSFAVPVPIRTNDGALVCRGPHGWTSLSLRLPGARLDPHRWDHVELLGAAAGELQTALRDYPTTPRPGRPLFSTLFGFPLPFRDPFTLRP